VAGLRRRRADAGSEEGQFKKAITIKAFPGAVSESDVRFPVLVNVDSGSAAVGRWLGIVSFRDDD
jgi:hypothetical protein